MKKHLTLVLISLFFVLGCGSEREDFVFTPDTDPSIEAGISRKRVSDLTPFERTRFVNAVKSMKTIPSQFEPSLNAYDYFVILHQAAFDDHDSRAHMHSNFLPWHREFLRRFELELRRAGLDETLFVPYWDWAHPGEFDSLFSDDFVGGNGDPDQDFIVTTGPFRAGQWDIVFLDETPDEHLPMEDGEQHSQRGLAGEETGPPHRLLLQEFDEFEDHDMDLLLGHGALQRNMGDPRAFFPVATEVAEAVSVFRPYDSPPFDDSVDIEQSFRNYVEGWWPRGSSMHNGVHVFIGGQMGAGTSPNDPVFFMHHAQVDRLWSLYQDSWGNDSYPEQFLDEELFEFPGVTVRQTFSLREHSGVRYQN